MKIHYEPELKKRAKILRGKSTLPEVLLWNRLKTRKLMGFRFIRQKPIDRSIVDFFCKDLGLIIEVDGPYHETKKSIDTQREKKLKSMGFHILRFNNSEILQDIESVISVIRSWIEVNT